MSTKIIFENKKKKRILGFLTKPTIVEIDKFLVFNLEELNF